MPDEARRNEEVSTQRRARILGLPYFDTSQLDSKPLYKDVLTVDEMYSLRVIPLQVDGHNIAFGITNNTSQQTMSVLKQRFPDQRVSFAFISDVGYRDYMKLYDPPKQVVYQDISITNSDSEELIQKVSAVLDKVRADDMLAYIVQQAHRLGASDTHFETYPEQVRIRFRIDGVLHPVARLSPEKYRTLVSAVASSANVSTSSTEAQQGHISQKVKMADSAEVDVNVRLETVTSINGMDMVMRLFNMDKSMYTLDRLGLSEGARKAVDDIIAKPSGLVLVVGPTGSGKTTTLYSILNSLNNDERKIITIEDPVEYQFPGITQISVTTKGSQEISFAEKLRAVLRLDPDIIMVGEVRDMDTAKTALQASLTGHLVMSTFHASSAAAALARLIDVIGQNPLFASAIRLVMAQRLVRKLDDASKKPYSPDKALLAKVQEIIDTMPDGSNKPDLAKVQFYQPGKSEDNPYGFHGQIALREQFIMTDELRRFFELGGTAVSAQEIEAEAIKNGMHTMLHDGVLKACEGSTTLDEVFRVVG